LSASCPAEGLHKIYLLAGKQQRPETGAGRCFFSHIRKIKNSGLQRVAFGHSAKKQYLQRKSSGDFAKKQCNAKKYFGNIAF
jgi:hypothetical protein